MKSWLILAFFGAISALLFAFYFYKTMKKKSEGTTTMIEIAQAIRDGARAYLRQQYRVVAIFFAVAFCVFLVFALILKIQNIWTPFVFITGGFFSGFSGFIGMKTATYASGRTAEASKISLNYGLQTAFRSGAVMGLSVVGLGLAIIGAWFVILSQAMNLPNSNIFYIHNYNELTSILIFFAIGASFQALFARVGGGIFTKAADVGADLVGKIESDIPEDDPRNPAVIADNVGDNVGDVAGMGADLYESFCGSILATSVLGTAAFIDTHHIMNSIILPMCLAGLGALCSIIGIFAVKTKESSSQKQLLMSLSRGVWLSSILVIISSYFLVNYLIPSDKSLSLWLAVITGLLVGIIIGEATEYFTSYQYKPTRNVAKQGLMGTSTLIIEGMSVGMVSTSIPVLTLGIGIIISFGLGSQWNWNDLANGLYGIGLAAVGMLSTLGITLATDAYGPIADNAGGIAQMSNLGDEVRERTDALDSLGNTTAATGKGFAIGSAALTAMVLLSAYIEEVKIALGRIGVDTMLIGNSFVETSTASIQQFVDFFNITLVNPRVLIGLFIGSMTTFVFCALTLKSVSRAAGKMVKEVRRQFKEHIGILEGTEKPEYGTCVLISTKAAQKEMILPSLLALIIPLIVGLSLGVAGVMGLLTGALTTGFTLAIMLNNSGAAWDNAKKFIESNKFGGKGSPAHKAAINGDTVGDPFKDTSGPSLNILIKLMSMVSIIFAGIVVSYSPILESLYDRTESTSQNKIIEQTTLSSELYEE